MSLIDSLRRCTTAVADTGDLGGITESRVREFEGRRSILGDAITSKHTDAHASLSFALPDQHPRLADGTLPEARPGGDLGRDPGHRTGPPGGDGLRLGLAVERLANRPGRAAGLPEPPRMA